MRRFLLVFLALVLAAILGAYFWTRAARNRVLETVDRANEEIDRLWVSDFNRPSLFPAPPPEADVDLDVASEDPVEAEVDEDDASFVDATDATSYYRQAETELAQLTPKDRETLQAVLLNPLDPESVAQTTELLERFAKAIALVEKGLAQSRCTPWDTPAHGQRLRSPQPEVQRFLFNLFLARSEQNEAAARVDDAAFDALRALAFAQDLSRNAPLASRFHFSGFQVTASQRLQGLLSQAPVGTGTTEKLLKSLVTLDEIEPTAFESLQFERLVLISGFGQVATSQRGPGAFDLRAGIFDLMSTHQLASAAEMTRAVVEELTPLIEKSATESLPALAAVSERLAASTNPMVSNLLPNLVRFKLVTTDASRQMRIAQLVAALQAHRQATGDFPATLVQLKGPALRRIPADPSTNQTFAFRPADEGAPAKLSSAGLENRLAPVECVIEVPPPVPSVAGDAPELLEQQGP